MKQFKLQLSVADNVGAQIKQGNQNIFGVMVESFLEEGNQKLIDGKAEVYGKSITDGCIGWEDTEIMMAGLSESITGSNRK